MKGNQNDCGLTYCESCGQHDEVVMETDGHHLHALHFYTKQNREKKLRKKKRERKTRKKERKKVRKKMLPMTTCNLLDLLDH